MFLWKVKKSDRMQVLEKYDYFKLIKLMYTLYPTTLDIR